MPWTQFDDHFADSEGALVAGVEACGLHLWATCWCAAHLRDGHVPAVMVKRWLAACHDEHGAELVARLIEAELWERTEDSGYRLLDFLKQNRSRAQVEADRDRKQAAGKKGGRVNAERNRNARSRPQTSKPNAAQDGHREADDDHMRNV